MTADGTVLIEDAQIIYRNFKGEERQYNRAGARNFHVILDPELARALERDNWNVKWPKEREIDGETVVLDPSLKINVGYRVRSPRIVMIGQQSGSQTELHEDNVDLLDDVDVVSVDVLFAPYNYDKDDPKKIAAYLRTMLITIEEDYLMQKLARMNSQEA